MSEWIKLLTDKSVAAGRALQSSQTGFVHYFYGDMKEVLSQTIPVYENLLFVLALFRTHRIESIQEGKELLQKILCFQNPLTGGFPLYLHEHPKEAYVISQIYFLAPLYWILKDYGHVLGHEMRTLINESTLRLLSYCLAQQKEKKISYAVTVRLICAELAYGILFQKEEWIAEGNKGLAGCEEIMKVEALSTVDLADLLVGLQMVEKQVDCNQWKVFWDFLNVSWNPLLCCYIGPFAEEAQEKREPRPHLFDLFLGSFAQKMSKRALLSAPFHLQGALIQPTKRVFSFSQQEENALCLSSGFKFFWGTSDFLHSFVYEKKNNVALEQRGNTIDLLFSLDEEGFSDNKKEEIPFYIDFDPGIRLLMNDQLVNTFELGETIHLNLGSNQCEIKSELVKGAGNFFGHFMRGNRSSQIANKGDQRFESYDWTLFIRTVRRTEPCQIKVSVTFS